MSIALPTPSQSAPLAQRGWPGLTSLGTALHMPFDLLRAQHAQAIQTGLLANSMLESRDFERRVDAFEHFCLGPFARSV